MNETDEHHLRAAEGWLDLDHAVEAAEELDSISPEAQSYPAVLLVRCRLYLDIHKPDNTHLIATALTEKIPELPDGWFYLACASARLNKNDGAEKALKKCFVAAARKDEEQKWQDRALATRDLEGYWSENQGTV